MLFFPGCHGNNYTRFPHLHDIFFIYYCAAHTSNGISILRLAYFYLLVVIYFTFLFIIFYIREIYRRNQNIVSVSEYNIQVGDSNLFPWGQSGCLSIINKYEFVIENRLYYIQSTKKTSNAFYQTD